MDTSETPLVTPPRLMDALVIGFNTVANHVYLLALPVALDIFLWLGPHLRIEKLFKAQLPGMMDAMRQMNPADNLAQLQAIEKFLSENVARVNILSSLSSLPIGVPSLIAGLAPLKSVLGTPLVYDTQNTVIAILLSLFFSLIGLALGTFYFNGITRMTETERQPFSLRVYGQQLWYTIVLVLLLIAALLAVGLPTLLLISVLGLISPSVAQMAMLMILFAIIWMVLPMIFSPHGIFAGRQTAVSAVFTSVQLVRRYLPGTGVFLLIALLLTQGLNQLWGAPPADSWLLLLGIAGHAFIYTALIAASFVYYRGGVRFMLQMQKKQSQPAETPSLL